MTFAPLRPRSASYQASLKPDGRRADAAAALPVNRAAGPDPGGTATDGLRLWPRATSAVADGLAGGVCGGACRSLAISHVARTPAAAARSREPIAAPASPSR